MSKRPTPKMFIAPNFPVFTYNEKGDLITDYPYIQDDCYYSGYVEDVPESVVVLSTCSGLWGHLMIYDLNYEIEPVKSSSTFQHVIYRMAADEDSPDRCGVTDEDIEDQATKGTEHQISMVQMERQLEVDKHELDTWYTSTRYLECYFVADKAKMYRPFGLHVVLIGLEFWTERDLITITHNLGDSLGFYSAYVGRFLMGRVHFDHTELILAPSYFCVLFNCIQARGKTTLYDATIVAHEMGHSLGFPHDDEKKNIARGCVCKCPRKGKCIMWSYSPFYICTEFSNCSRADYFNMIRKPGKTCLLNIPEKKIFGTQMCGNGVIEDEEECDCGMDELHKQGKICRESIAAHLAPLSCFKAVNTEGDRCGNCGGDGLTYNKCQDKDVLCGRLQCVNVKKIPQMKSLGSIVQTPVDDILCWGTEFHAGMDMVDVGSVRDGTACGDNKDPFGLFNPIWEFFISELGYSMVLEDRGFLFCRVSNSDIVIIMGIAIGSILLLLLVLSFAVHKRTQIAQILSRPSWEENMGGSSKASKKKFSNYHLRVVSTKRPGSCQKLDAQERSAIEAPSSSSTERPVPTKKRLSAAFGIHYR
ncbi:Disintegrin and metalloproteinase domain-containing protein 9 [Chelonia mydas]|uniref:Disintegrin and metalloproteinase domain-containing protein 9 n=1 Tax=Chelonia mydas TaxID=8469 RepID=M7BID2_CHEMY|nr:Disintegrin and metalloproteinase domain-containing protein 9 [Chelonia mydas]